MSTLSLVLMTFYFFSYVLSVPVIGISGPLVTSKWSDILERQSTEVVPAGGFEDWLPADQPCPAGTYQACTFDGFNICAPDETDSTPVTDCGLVKKRLESGEGLKYVVKRQNGDEGEPLVAGPDDGSDDGLGTHRKHQNPPSDDDHSERGSLVKERQDGDEVEPNLLDSAGSSKRARPSLLVMCLLTVSLILLSFVDLTTAAVVPRSNETAEFGYDFTCNSGLTGICADFGYSVSSRRWQGSLEAC